MQVTCPDCKTTSSTKVDCSGKTVKCSCGKSFVVPKAASAAAEKIATQKITVKCACGRTLQAPSTAVGKAVKCPCGEVIKVPDARTPAAATAAANVVQPIAAQRVVAAAGAAPTQRRAVSSQAMAVSFVPNAFASISDDEWQSLVKQNTARTVENKPKEKTATSSLLDQARVDLGVSKVERQSGAKGHLSSSRWILIGIGALKLVIALIQLYFLNATMDSLAAEADDVDLDLIRLIIQVICGISIGIASSFIIMGAMVFLFPMTCTITALCLFVLTEIGGLIANPFSLISIRGWIVRLAMGGALVQAINNAAYYKYIKAEARKSKK